MSEDPYSLGLMGNSGRAGITGAASVTNYVQIRLESEFFRLEGRLSSSVRRVSGLREGRSPQSVVDGLSGEYLQIKGVWDLGMVEQLPGYAISPGPYPAHSIRSLIPIATRWRGVHKGTAILRN